MRYSVIGIFFFILPIFIQAQNLVPNPSFEDTLTCPDNIGQVYKAKEWSSFRNTPDYFNACCNTEVVRVPDNDFGSQSAASGNAYCGLYTFLNNNNKDIREIIGSQLLTPLVSGTKYYASIKVSLADSFVEATDKIGISFSTIPYDSAISMVSIDNRAKIYASSIIIDNKNWVTVSGTFIADSAYKYILIGNFFTDNNTNHVVKVSANPISGSYYYIDNVCVSPDSLTCDMSSDIENTINSSHNIYIYPNPANERIFFKKMFTENLECSIINLLGEKIKSIILYNSTSINVSNLPDGLYILQIQYLNKIIQKKQFIVH